MSFRIMRDIPKGRMTNNMRKFTKVVAACAAGALSLSLGACSSSTDDGATGDDTAKDVVTLKVGASPTPHGKILKFVNDNLAEDAGIKLDIVEYQDYIQPNEALASGDLDANYFQTVPYLEDQKKANDSFADFVAGEGIHLEPLGLYSDKIKDVDELKDGATIGIINDPTNQGRGLELLASQDLIKLPESGDINVAKIQGDKKLNPHGFEFKEIEGPQLARSLADIDAAVINGNFAQSAGKAPADAVVVEEAKDNPNNNVLVWKKGSDKQEAIDKLEELLHSDEVADYIAQEWPDKAVIFAGK